jgi:hypothetical protein
LPRRRNRENQPLPRGWRWYHGAYQYQVPRGLEARWDGKKQFRLGATLAEAHAEFAKRVGVPTDKITTCGQMLDWYATYVVPTYKNPLTRAGKLEHMKHLRPVFADMPVAPFKPAWVYGYVERRVHKLTGKKALTAAHREIETFSHAFTKLVQKGDIDKHPFKDEVRLDGDLALKPKNVRYVEDWEIVEALSLQPRRKKGSVLMCLAYMRLKLVAPVGRSDMLRLRLGEHLKDDGIHVTRHKTAETSGKTTVYDYAKVPERRRYVEEAIAARPALSPFLFCNRRGEGYIDEATGECHGFESVWQRFMDRVLAETKVTRRFTEHDIRRKAGSDAESLEKARALLQHAESRTTQRFYRFKPERV